MVICLDRGADLPMAQLMLLPLTVSCFSKIQIGFTFLALAHPGSPGQRAVKRMYVQFILYTITFLQYHILQCQSTSVQTDKHVIFSTINTRQYTIKSDKTMALKPKKNSLISTNIVLFKILIFFNFREFLS